MSKYRKLITAVVGVALIFLNDNLGVSLPWENAEAIMAILIPILTAFGVWAVPNET